MKTRRSSDISKQAPKKRKQPKRRLEDDDKENYGEGQRREKGKPQSGINFSRSKDDGKSRKRKKHNKERGKGFEELYGSLQANNRALATALQATRVQNNEVNQENLSLKRQIQCERQFYIERIEKEVEQKVKAKFQDVADCLQETICKLLESSKLISSAIDMVSMPTNTTETFTPGSCPCPTHSCDTTPPPEEPDYMEVTAAEPVAMETTITELGNIVTIFSKETDLNSSQLEALKGVNHIPGALVPNCDQEVFGDEADDTSEASDDSQTCTVSSLEMPSRKKRRSSTNVSYAMPSLRSKLRRGDPFTDPFFQGTFCLTNSKRKGRMSTGCIRKKPFRALRNLTNVITEERQDVHSHIEHGHMHSSN